MVEEASSSNPGTPANSQQVDDGATAAAGHQQDGAQAQVMDKMSGLQLNYSTSG